MNQKSLVLYPTDPNCIKLGDLKLYNQYFYFQMNGVGGREEPFYYAVPGIKTFYVDSVFHLDGWYKRNFSRTIINDRTYLEMGAFSRCSRGGLNGSPIFIRELYEDKDNQEGALFGDRKIVKSLGTSNFFTPGTRKTMYIYDNKLTCLKGLKIKIEEDLARANRSLEYLRNQLIDFYKNPIHPPKNLSSLPNYVPAGNKIWIAWYETSWYPHAGMRGDSNVMDGSVSIKEYKPSEITISREIPDWNKGFFISSSDLTDGIYSSHVCVGRTKEECEYFFRKDKKNSLETEIIRTSRRINDVLEKSLANIKRKIEKES